MTRYIVVQQIDLEDREHPEIHAWLEDDVQRDDVWVEVALWCILAAIAGTFFGSIF